MKNKKILGIPMTLFIFGLLVIGGVSAALVSYLSNTIQAEVTVSSPVVLDQELFGFGDEVLNDGYNHYLLIKGLNSLDVEVPATPIITIKKDGATITDTTGIHLGIDVGGDIHYCYEDMGDMTGITDCDTDYVLWLENNPDWFDWAGTDATYELSTFVSPVINHGGNSWMDVSSLFVNGVLTLPETGVDPGLIAALLVIRGDFGLAPGDYTIEVVFNQ